MTVVPLLVVLSLSLVGAALGLYLWSVGLGDAEHCDRLSLLPLEEDLCRQVPGRNERLETSNAASGEASDPSAAHTAASATREQAAFVATAPCQTPSVPSNLAEEKDHR